ncbi:MAG: adenosine deaminase family protein [Candidatus Gastranaerophilales bacterium]|nr:adenosine deaminase family protein [Candidatus Gastranaerophilales bacterium]
MNCMQMIKLSSIYQQFNNYSTVNNHTASNRTYHNEGIDAISFTSGNDTIKFNNSYNIYNDDFTDMRRLVAPELKALYKAMPKSELHVHLRGAATLSHVRQILRRKGADEEKIAYETTFPDYFIDLKHFVRCYDQFVDNLKTPNDMREVAYFTCTRAAEDNVRYLELRIDPSSKEMMEATLRGVRDAQEHLKDELGFKQIVKIIILAKRHYSPEKSLENAKIAVELAKNNNMIVGFDLAGSEAENTVLKHKEAIKYAVDHGLNVTVHAGETPNSIDKTPNSEGIKYELTGAESIKEAINLGAKRIGHGVHLLEDPELVQMVKDKKITIEVNATSNVSLKSVESWKKHPINNMIKNGINVAICTDNPTLLKTTLSREYERLYKHNYVNNWEEMKKLTLNGIDGGFMSAEEKVELREEFRKELERIEADPYFADAIKRYLTPKLDCVA